MHKVLVIHGPNLNLLGEREVSIYGLTTIDDINKTLIGLGAQKGLAIVAFQSNHEGEIVDKIGQAKKDKVEAIIINPAAYTHTSVAIRDAISASGLPVVEVHLSNIYSREEFRHTSLIAPVAKGQIAGFGKTSYILALDAIMEFVR
ncbi:MAG: type II 3-dehydroquinate dehydratase [Candidatus Omnitrophica bacterium]|nr:type II 3-dehydroquinate dehydratase [Candidatus Omnitrophota bacterium]